MVVPMYECLLYFDILCQMWRSISAYLQKKTVMKWLGFTIACIAIMCSSTLNAYNAYANDLKSLYNLTQYESKS